VNLLTLAIDVGGSSIKAIILREVGTAASERSQIPTPHPATPEVVVAALLDLIAGQGTYDRLAIGFPSVVEHGVTRGAINLHTDWDGVPLAQVLQEKIEKPLRIANDADVQGCGRYGGCEQWRHDASQFHRYGGRQQRYRHIGWLSDCIGAISGGRGRQGGNGDLAPCDLLFESEPECC